MGLWGAELSLSLVRFGLALAMGWELFIPGQVCEFGFFCHDGATYLPVLTQAHSHLPATPTNRTLSPPDLTLLQREYYRHHAV